ncbi:Stk1 family PASTA domain-containing Ser/Thr kinase [Mycolicibacterium sediminis]|uniref:Serine/threonine-protein kinase PknB n=1 Tax=Mycolicibacterium sediminis TaxID=1286180 RepID=A0A7I7QL48_9MYCO|nr:Stk1 family PASTA domain-containing Ser/Thr kinase [Mycolicibacterium sediminis]BBY27021.1 serine/threonine-protein kinase PknB [Mycolicibacterium sediminis]
MTTPSRFADRYELREVVGIGGMSEVHLARDLRLDRDVAVKVMRADLATDSSLNARFRREAQKLAGLNHPAIVAVYDTGEAQTAAGRVLYIVMEYVDGLTVRDVLRTRGPMTPRRAVAVAAEVCQALEFSHRRGIVHRDVKPANILIGDDGAVKVVDFGISRVLADGAGSDTQTGAVMGTAHYLSPEQARGGNVDARSDVYSIGCVLHEMVTGEPPFVGDSPVAIAYQHVREDPPAPSSRNAELTPEFDAVVLKAMAKDPADRYQTAAQMRVDLIRLQNGDAPYAATASAAERTSPLPPVPSASPKEPTRDRASTRRTVVTAVAAIAAIAVVVAVALHLTGSGSDGTDVPDVRGRALTEAVAALQDSGLTARVREQAHATVPADRVIDTTPAAKAVVDAGSVVTLDVSTGPVREGPAANLVVVPDVSSLTYAEAVRALMAAGFVRFQQAPLPSTPEMADRVLATNPAADRTVETTAAITVLVGTGPAPAGS